MRTLPRRSLLAAAAGTVASSLPASSSSRPQGDPAAVQSRRAPSVDLRRWVDAIGQDATTPLGALSGVITPSDLHFSRHHFGAPVVDAATYSLLVHGLVERPLVFTLDDLRRMPSRSCICFLECAGNGAGAFRRPHPRMSAQAVDGATSTSEWVGVPLAAVLEEAGVSPAATWLLAESGDAGLYARSIPLSKAYEDALLTYVQNGEPLRVEQGFPLRLILPGWEGSASVKWLRRIELLASPAMTRDETARYSDISRDGKIHPFVFVIDVKSIITSPSYPDVVSEGWLEIRGLAWSGRGRISQVDVSTDGGDHWVRAELDAPVLPKAHTRFRFAWKWDGDEAVLMSRAWDDTGSVQPTLAQFRESRPASNDYRNNYIRAWRVSSEGQVFFASGC